MGAVDAREVPVAHKDEREARHVDVLRALALLQVVDVEKDPRVGQHLDEALLHDAHLVLPRTPDVAQEGVVLQRRHERTHRGIKPYRCHYPGCNKAFVHSRLRRRCLSGAVDTVT